MREPSNELSTLAIAMSVAVLNDRCATDPDFATFLYEDMGPGLAKRLSKERSNDENVSEHLSSHQSDLNFYIFVSI